jgi:hypothetical protein
MEIILFFLAALFAEIAGTVAGFGSSTIFMPLALFFVEFRAALILVALFHVAGNLAKSLFFRRGFDWKLFVTFGLPSVVLTVTGALLVAFVPQDALKFVLGLFLLAFSLRSLFGPGFLWPRANWATVLGGCVSGFFAGLLGTGGAFRAVVLSSLKLRKDSYIVMNAVIAVLVDITRIPVYIGGGFLPAGSWLVVLGLGLVAIVGAFVGKRIVDVLPQKAFRIIVLAALGLVGLKFVFDFLR